MNAKYECPNCGNLFLKARECPDCKVATVDFTKSVETKKLNLEK